MKVYVYEAFLKAYLQKVSFGLAFRVTMKEGMRDGLTHDWCCSIHSLKVTKILNIARFFSFENFQFSVVLHFELTVCIPTPI